MNLEEPERRARVEIEPLRRIAIGLSEQGGREPEEDLREDLHAKERAVEPFPVEHPSFDETRDERIDPLFAGALATFVLLAESG